MEKNSVFGSHPHPYRMSPNNPSLFHSNTKSVCEIPHLVEESTFMSPFSGFLHLNSNNSRNWLHSNTLLYHDPFPPLFNSQRISTAGSTPPQRIFFVYDQSCNTTTMIYNSKVQIGTSRVAINPPNAYNLSKEEGLIRVSSNSNPSNPPLRRSMDNCEATKDEMHEDTEELNALLSSDDDDEETSTGNSPSTVIDNGSLEPVVEIGEQVVSFAGWASTKRRRTQHSPTALADDDAESVYVGSDKHCHKRFRRDKIHETLRTLRCLIPGSEGKNAVVVIDEAVDYLRSLKVKAKALGL